MCIIAHAVLLRLGLWRGYELIDRGGEYGVARVKNHHHAQHYGPVLVGKVFLQIFPICV